MQWKIVHEGNTKLDSIEYYNDHFSVTYSEKAASRINYLDAIDALIIEQTKKAPKAYLDIGCGDGRRTRKISQSIKANKTVGIDNSEKMLSFAETDKLKNINFYCAQTEDLMKGDQRFDLITLLWNILVHVPSFKDREKLLKDCEAMLSSNGNIMLDINNRFNISAYGIKNFFKNMILDIFKDEAGWNELEAAADKKHRVYIHSFKELVKIINLSGLKITVVKSVNYETGKRVETNVGKLFFGQIFLVLERSN